MRTFAYPKSRHVRTEQPPRLTAYRGFKPYLRREFRRRCVYCSRVDVGAVSEFGVDHYRPKRHFPHLACDYSNLFYCCNDCNRLKGSRWPTPDDFRRGAHFVNPCEHVMFEHVRFHGVSVKSHSLAGGWMIDTLLLNAPGRIELRQVIAAAAAQWNSQLATIQATLKQIGTMISDPKTASAKRAALVREERNTLRRVEQIRNQLESIAW